MERKVYISFIFITTFMISSCKNVAEAKSSTISFIKEELHNGDAKYYNEQVITSVNGQLTLVDTESNHIETLPVQANWIDSYENENLIVYGNSNKEIGLCELDDNNGLIRNKVIFSSTYLMIDPSVTKYQDTYYMTVTSIGGEVNNGDPAKENGQYAVDLYATKDPFGVWSRIARILSESGNIEDGELYVEGDKMFFLFEKEVLDCGVSTLDMIRSTDGGLSWPIRKTIIDNQSDNEPAAIVETSTGWDLYYSSDMKNEGESYAGATAYVSTLDEEFNLIATNELRTVTEKGILLYDVKQTPDSLKILYARDYKTTADLIEEVLPF